MNLLIVNFHYCGKDNAYKAGIFPISAERLSRQLDALGSYFSFVSQRDLLDAVNGKIKLPDRSCLITFDDGLACQYEIALPILKRKGIPAGFFVSSLPYVEHKACLVHKTHYILSAYPISEIADCIEGYYHKCNPSSPKESIIDRVKTEATGKYRYDDPVTASVKTILNTDSIFNATGREEIISSLFYSMIPDEQDFVDSWYLSTDQLKELAKKEMIGLHSMSHSSLASLPVDQIEKDLRSNKENIEKIIGQKVFSISFPYGGKSDVDSSVIGVCKKIGCQIGFTMERSFNESLTEPLLFARLDTNDAIGGKKPLFEINGGVPHIIGRMTNKRSIFCVE